MVESQKSTQKKILFISRSVSDRVDTSLYIIEVCNCKKYGFTTGIRAKGKEIIYMNKKKQFR